ncbi:hypothetical protein [Streptomyces subrutilus]|uniref:Lipoprotein n=1 Tax=Streptomyces subrutilus TaxID=36818 RepID=A0A1E5PKH4_9ACTN|nr:hypothetical protein [Streptomyces subrutilus]OEJ30047.1 hypothetical protein BGK67_00390 [Streptomyces subrutilus]
MRRWSLPLLLVALLAASGCVTVHPAPTRPAGASPAAVSEDHKHPVAPRPERPDTGAALPLSPMPGPAAAPPADAAPEAGRAPAPARPASSAREAGETQPARRAPDRRAEGPVRPRRTTPAMRPAAKPKPRKVKRPTRTPAPHRPVRAPGAGTADMAELCRAAHGVTSPAVAALCHQTYGR